MENKIIEIENKINELIKNLVENFNSDMKLYTPEHVIHTERLARIDGLIDALSILTGKKYIITIDGLEEKSE